MDQEKMLQLRKSKKIFAACEKWSSLQRRAWITDSAASGGADHLAMLPKRATDDLAETTETSGNPARRLAALICRSSNGFRRQLRMELRCWTYTAAGNLFRF